MNSLHWYFILYLFIIYFIIRNILLYVYIRKYTYIYKTIRIYKTSILVLSILYKYSKTYFQMTFYYFV